MPKQTVSVEIEDSGYKIVKAVGEAIAAVKAAKAAGGGVPAEVAAGLTSAVEAAASIGAVAGDLKESKEEFMKGVNLAAYELYDSFVK